MKFLIFYDNSDFVQTSVGLYRDNISILIQVLRVLCSGCRPRGGFECSRKMPHVNTVKGELVLVRVALNVGNALGCLWIRRQEPTHAVPAVSAEAQGAAAAGRIAEEGLSERRATEVDPSMAKSPWQPPQGLWKDQLYFTVFLLSSFHSLLVASLSPSPALSPLPCCHGNICYSA